MECDGEKHRADICVEEKKMVIEFQHSPISSDEFERRCLFYTSAGYQLIWVFDAAGKIKDPNAYVIPPYVNGRIYCMKDYFTQELEWKRKQNTFVDFPKILNLIGPQKIAVYFETQVDMYPNMKILIGAKSINEKYITAYYTSQYILQENFLKGNGGITSEDVLSIGEIMQETKRIQEQVTYRTSHNMLRRFK